MTYDTVDTPYGRLLLVESDRSGKTLPYLVSLDGRATRAASGEMDLI